MSSLNEATCARGISILGQGLATCSWSVSSNLCPFCPHGPRPEPDHVASAWIEGSSRGSLYDAPHRICKPFVWATANVRSCGERFGRRPNPMASNGRQMAGRWPAGPPTACQGRCGLQASAVIVATSALLTATTKSPACRPAALAQPSTSLTETNPGGSLAST